MGEIDVNERIEAIVARFFVPRPRTILGSAEPYFDIGNPNFHDSKAEFGVEKDAVNKALAEAHSLLEF